MKIILNLMVILAFLTPAVIAQENSCPKAPLSSQEQIKKQKEIDEMLKVRLSLTKEQIAYINQNRPKRQKEFEAVFLKMQTLHAKIKKAYEQMPKFQADLLTAPMKTELAMLKQNIQNLKQENRKNFENILNPEQKAEFEIIKKEFAAKKAACECSERNGN